MYILVLEASTTSAKALLYNQQSKTYQMTIKAFDKFSSNGFTQNPEKVYQELVKLKEELMTGKHESLIDKTLIITTWHSLLWLDKDYKPLSHVYLWSYGHKSESDIEDYRLINGCPKSMSYPLYKALLSLNDLPIQSRDKLAYLSDLGSYLMYKFSARLLTSHNMASGTGLYNLMNKNYDFQLINTLKKGIGLDFQLPPIQEDVTTNIVGPFSDGGMNHLDVLSQFEGDQLRYPDLKNLDREQVVSMSVGTSTAIRIYSDELKSRNGLWCYRLNEGYILGGATASGCNIVDHYKKQWFQEYSYDQVEYMLDAIKDRKFHPIYLPFELGERSPGYLKDRKAGFIQMEGIEEISHIAYYASVLEGVLFNLYQIYLELVADAKEKPLIYLSGGILNSKYWTQMCCDIFNCPLMVNQQMQSSLFGGLAMVGQSVYSELDMDDSNQRSRIISPKQIKHEQYMIRFDKYLEAYKKSV